MQIAGYVVLVLSLGHFWKFGKYIRSDKESERSRAFVFIFTGVFCIVAGLKMIQNR